MNKAPPGLGLERVQAHARALHHSQRAVHCCLPRAGTPCLFGVVLGFLWAIMSMLIPPVEMHTSVKTDAALSHEGAAKEQQAC